MAIDPTVQQRGEIVKGGTNVTPYVIADIERRSAVGREKYGTELQANNGRIALIDAYQEALDLVMYLRQELIERGIGV